MELRLYILAGLLLLALVGLGYLLYALVGYRRAVGSERAAALPATGSDTPTYLGPAAERLDDVFQVGSRSPEPALGTRRPAPGTPLQPVRPAPDRHGISEASIPIVHAATGTSMPTLEPTSAAECPREPVPEPVPAPELAPVTQPGPAPEPEPEPTPAPEPEPEPTPAPISEPEREPEPEPAPEPEPEPEPAPSVPPTGYSISEQLEQLMASAGEASPLLTPEEHAEYVESPGSVASSDIVTPPIDSALVPRPSVGQVLSAPRTEGEADEPMRAGAPGLPSEERTHHPDYTLVAPVELHFTEGGGRLGVRVGTRTHAEFQRLAGILLGDLKAGRDS